MAEPLTPQQEGLYAVLAEFDTPERLVEAVRTMREQGWRGLDAFSPFPIDAMPEALGLSDQKVPIATLIGGVTGAVTGFGMQVYTNLDYPLWVGGRPLVAVPAFMLITFELMVLFAVLAGIGTMLLANRLPKLHHPLFEVERFQQVTDDRFFLGVRMGSDVDRQALGKALAALRPEAIIDVPAEAVP